MEGSASDFEKLDDDWKKIIKFFVINTPCEKVSAREKPFTEYGWDDKNPKKEGYLHKKLLEIANLERDINYFTCEKLDEEIQMFSNADMNEAFYDKCISNRIAFLINGNEVISLFKAIRNGFAHARFTIRLVDTKEFIAMENGVAISANQFEVKARIFISKETLLSWIDLIQNGAQTEKRLLEEEKLRIEAGIVKTINSGINKSLEVIISNLDFDEYKVKKVINELNKKKIEYSKKEKQWVVINKQYEEDM